ncbi:hypothetical protein ABC969_02250 [Sphingomonas qilianensis]|uniref:Uncharacterized protein n=2 Tax=Sphingomonas qilianensis TaxID=1736690 RepID=A0ABU9XN50_9SPHN
MIVMLILLKLPAAFGQGCGRAGRCPKPEATATVMKGIWWPREAGRRKSPPVCGDPCPIGSIISAVFAVERALRQPGCGECMLLPSPTMLSAKTMPDTPIDRPIGRPIDRIDAAIARIAAAAARRAQASDALAKRHAALRTRMTEAVAALDEVIARGKQE